MTPCVTAGYFHIFCGLVLACTHLLYDCGRLAICCLIFIAMFSTCSYIPHTACRRTLHRYACMRLSGCVNHIWRYAVKWSLFAVDRGISFFGLVPCMQQPSSSHQHPAELCTKSMCSGLAFGWLAQRRGYSLQQLTVHATKDPGGQQQQAHTCRKLDCQLRWPGTRTTELSRTSQGTIMNTQQHILHIPAYTITA